MQIFQQGNRSVNRFTIREKRSTIKLIVRIQIRKGELLVDSSYATLTVTMEIQFDRIPLACYSVRYKVPVAIRPIELLHFPIQFADTSKYVDTKVSTNSNFIFTYLYVNKNKHLYYLVYKYNITLGMYGNIPFKVVV